MSDLMERLRTMAAGKSDDLDIAAEAIEEIIDLNWQIINLEKDRDELRAENAQLDVVARACNEQLMAVEKERDRVRLALDVAIAAGKECEGQIAELRAQIERTCTWQSDQDGVYSTECGHAFVFNDGTPEQNNQRFCGYCGGGLIVPAAPDDIYEALREQMVSAGFDAVNRDTEIIMLEHERDELRAETARLRGNLADCAERAAYWKDRAEFSEDQLAQIAAHEKVCAGKWVRCDDRLPEPRRVVYTRTADNSWMPSNWIEGGAWRIAHNEVVEWLDARLPGEER